MTEIRNEIAVSVQQEGWESAYHPDLDAILAQWLFIAGFAWEGFVLAGRGAVVIEVDDGSAEFAYRPGGDRSCRHEEVESYDAEAEVVVVMRRSERHATYKLGGWPAPPDAYAMITADLIGATVN